MARSAVRSTATALPPTRSRRSKQSSLEPQSRSLICLSSFGDCLLLGHEQTCCGHIWIRVIAREGGTLMNKALITAIVLLAGVPASAVAQERAGSAALGAVSGAVVLGPVGAVAGAVIGYTAGPSIARSWGMHGSGSARHRQPSRREANRAPPRSREAMEANGQMSAAPVQPAPAAQPIQTAPPAPPPAQGFE
jgi:hypothetical protein